MGSQVETAAGNRLAPLRTLSERLGPCPWGPASALLIDTQSYWEIQSADRPPGLNQNDLMTVALRLARIDESSPRFPRVTDTQCVGGQIRVTVEAVSGKSLIQGLSPGSYSIQGWAFALREMLTALREMQYVGLSHGRIDTHSFRRQDDGRIVLDYFQPLAFAELPGEATNVYCLKSPERNRKISFPVGLPSDLFAVGQLARTMLERGVDPQLLAKDPRVAPAERVLKRLTATDPQDRYAHPESALHDLDSLADPQASTQSILDPLRREPLPGHLQLVGRQAERYRLVQAWTRTQAGQRDPVLVVGPPASGRSELLLHHHRDLLLAGHFSVFLSPSVCGASSRGFVQALLHAIDQRCAIRNETERLRQLLKGEREALIHASPCLQERFGTPDPATHNQVSASSYRWLLTELLASIGPIAIFVDDADRCEGLSGELFRGLIEQSSAKGVHWVASAHKPLLAWTGASDASPQQDTHPIVNLAPHDLTLSRAILQQHLGTQTLPQGLLEWLGLSPNRPAQIPIHTVDSGLSEGTLFRKNNRWQLLASARHDPSKAGVRPIIIGTAGSIESPSPSRAFLLRCAALGPGVQLDPLLNILSPDGEGARWLEYSVRMGACVCYSDGAHRLAHHSFIPKLLSPLSPKQRRKLHNELFSALCRVSDPEKIPEWHELCAEQGYWAQLHSGQRQRLMLDAIERALQRHDQEALERWFDRFQERTQEPIEDTNDYFTLAEAAQRIGNPIQAHQELAHALSVATNPLQRAQIKLRIAKLGLSSNDLDLADTHASEALALLPRPSDEGQWDRRELAKLNAQLQIVLCAARLYSGPIGQLAWTLLRVWSTGAGRVSPLARMHINFMLGVLFVRIAPRAWTSQVTRRFTEGQHALVSDEPQLRAASQIMAWRNATILAAFGSDPMITFKAYNLWRGKAASREEPLTRRTMLIGMRMLYAGLGAYALARDALDQLPLEDRYPEESTTPSVLACSRYNANLALGEAMPSRVPIAFEQAPRGSRCALMALEIERLCHIGEITAARTVAARLKAMIQASPLLDLPIPGQLARVYLAYGLLGQALRKHDPAIELQELRAIRKEMGRRAGSAPSHYRVIAAFELYFSGRHNAALTAFARAEAVATRQRALLALHWIERGRAHVAVARKETSNRISKLAQGAIHYAEQMPSAAFRDQVRETFGLHLRAARAWTGQRKDQNLALTENLHQDPQARPLHERFDACQRALAQSRPQGSNMFAFLDALLESTQAKRAAIIQLRSEERLELLAARDKSGLEIELDFHFDQALVQRCLSQGSLQHRNSEETPAQKIRSALAVPYLEQGRPTGVVYLDDPDCSYRFDHNDLSLVAGMAPQLPLLVELERLTSTSKQHGLEVQGLQARSEHFAQALALSEAKREQLLTYVHEPVILIDADQGAILELSASARELLRDSRNKLIGAHYAELFPSDRVQRHREMLSRAITNGKANLSNELLEFPGGQQIPVNVHLRRVDFGELRAVQATFEDLRERNHLQAQIRKAQKVEAMGTLASGIAHDFNNFLSAIGTVAESLPDKDSNRPAGEQRQIILDTVGQASRLTSQMLDLTRERRSKPTPIDLHAHLRMVMGLLSPSLGPKVRYEMKLDEESSHVYIDQSELTQIILNLTVNARDAMPNGGTLTVSSQHLEPGDPQWEQFERLDARPYRVLSFQDTGTGIPKALLPQIFDAFFTTKTTGNGLGLATVQELVTRNHGSITVQSKVYQGTTFRIALPEFDPDRTSSSPLLPAVSGDAPAPETPEPDTRPRTSSQLSDSRPRAVLLYVEDDDTIRPLLCEALRNAGHEVHAFGRSIDALTWYDQHQPPLSLLLTDLQMPGVSGQELYFALRSKLPDLGVLYLTGSSGQGLASRHSEQVRVLQKPFSTRTLVHTVRKILVAQEAVSKELLN